MSKCPNCSEEKKDHDKDVCMVAAIGGVVRERGKTSAKKLRALIANCNVDALWDDLGRVIDAFERGDYSQ